MIEARIDDKLYKSSSILSRSPLKFIRFGSVKDGMVEFHSNHFTFFSKKYKGHLITMDAKDFIKMMEQKIEEKIFEENDI